MEINVMPQDQRESQKRDAPVATLREPSAARNIPAQRDWENGSLVARTAIINRPRADVYAFWRDFRNLALFLENVESVEIVDERRSRWTISAPAGYSVSWNAILTTDRPNEVIAWESDKDADIKNSGNIEFRDSSAGRGTEVRITILYQPPAGEVGRIVAKLFRKEPKIQMRQDLRRVKQLLETGEISRSKPGGNS
jgi:uncharacterized membrane protein